MPVNKLRENDEVVRCLQHAIDEGEHGLSVVPGLIKRVIVENCWRERHVDVLQWRPVTFRSFAEFLAERPPEGLGATLAQVKRLCADDPEAMDLIDQATAGRQGKRTDLVDNIHEVPLVERPAGTSPEAALRRLRKDRPDLHSQVLKGELSAHAAAVQAGFRPRTITVPLDPEKMARAIRRRLSDDELDVLLEALEAAS